MAVLMSARSRAAMLLAVCRQASCRSHLLPSSLLMLGQGGGDGTATAMLFGGFGGGVLQVDWGVSIGKISFVLILL